MCEKRRRGGRRQAGEGDCRDETCFLQLVGDVHV